MMNLHNNTELFEQIVLLTSNTKKIDATIIRQDYFVSLLLQNLVKHIPDIIFKGGTSLSKCFGVISRYSEDIDLNYLKEGKFTDSSRKSVAYGIVDAINASPFTYSNPEELQSGKNMNTYMVTVPYANTLTENIKVESFLASKSYPTEKKEVSCYIVDLLKSLDKTDIIEQYDLAPFEINVQSLVRTVIDKVFAICDYYESKTSTRNSRHIYDLFKTVPAVTFDDNYFALVEQVRIERKSQTINVSAQDGYKVFETIVKIRQENFYKSDYNRVTMALIFDRISYEKAASVLNTISNAYMGAGV